MTNQPNAKMFTYEGKRLSLYGWSQELGIARVTLKKRIYDYGWPIQRALSEPVRDYVPKPVPKKKKYRGKTKRRLRP